MSNRPFRFVHAADFHLEQPGFGVPELPEHLVELVIDAPYRAGERVFDAALAEEAEFLVLAGDILNPLLSGPRGPLFLATQFARLAEREIPVYWTSGRVDLAESWPTAIRLPENVHVFPAGRPEYHIHQRDGLPVARIVGASRMHGRAIHASDFEPDPGGLPTVAVLHGIAEADALRDRGIDYWALGGSHERNTLFSAPHVAHYPGSPQGRQPSESGPHGCTLVQFDDQRHIRTTLIATDVMRWTPERLMVDEATTRDELEVRLRQRIGALREAAPGIALLISWSISGSGPVLAELRHGRSAAGLLETLRSEYGSGPVAAWSLTLAAEDPAAIPPAWYEQQTIRGDFLRALRDLGASPDQPIDLESMVSAEHLAGMLGDVATISDPAILRHAVAEASALGVDLLSGEDAK
jgi:DNA repair protein SbcD/Mre11